jgi:hypothetical protein
MSCWLKSRFIEFFIKVTIGLIKAKTEYLAHNMLKASYNRHSFNPPRTLASAESSKVKPRILHSLMRFCHFFVIIKQKSIHFRKGNQHCLSRLLRTYLPQTLWLYFRLFCPVKKLK